MVSMKTLYWILKTYRTPGLFQRLIFELSKRLGIYRVCEKYQLMEKDSYGVRISPFVLPRRTSGDVTCQGINDGIPLPGIVEAMEVLKGEIRYFAGPSINCGFPPKWFRDYSGSQKPSAHWSKIRTIAKDHKDIKLTWEPSRFLFIFPLARAYHSTKDDRFAESFWQAFEDWQKNNPAYLGPNWICGQEISIRVISWSFGVSVFADSRATTSPRLALLKETLILHANRILRTRGYALSQRNNHAISEAVGLITIASLLPEHPSSRWLREIALEQLVMTLEDQFDEEGAYIQHSFNYHRFAMELLIWTVFLLRQRSEPVPAPILETLARSLDFLKSFMDPFSGALPQYGQDDGTLLFSLTDCARRDFRPVLQALSYICNKREAFHEGPWDELTRWLFEDQRSQRIAITEPHNRSRSFPRTGYHIFCGPMSHLFIRGAKYRTRPGQADNLHIDFWFQGKNILFDPGTLSYNPVEPRWEKLSHSFTHNVAGIMEQDQMIKSGNFLWLDWPVCFIFATWKNEETEYLELEQFAYKSFPGGVFQRRGILRHLDTYWVLDSISTRNDCGLFVGFNLSHEPVCEEGELSFPGTCPYIAVRCISSMPFEDFIFHKPEASAFGWQAKTYQDIAPLWRFERRRRGTRLTHVIALGDQHWVRKTRLGINGSVELPHELGLAVQFEDPRKPMVVKGSLHP